MPLFTLIVTAGLVLSSLVAQSAERAPTLFITLSDAGGVRAWLSWTRPLPDSTRRILAETMGCAESGPGTSPAQSTSLQVECRAAIRRDGLKWFTHWDLASLGKELSGLGAGRVSLSLNLPRAAYSRVSPAWLVHAGGSGFSDSYSGEGPTSELHDVTIEAGIEGTQVWRAGMAAGLLLLLPLLLLPLRRSGPALGLAAAKGLFCLGATVWLCITLPLSIPAQAPPYLSFPVLSAPLFPAIWLASRITGGAERKSFFWRGIGAVAFLTMIAGLFSATSAMLTWAVCGLTVIAACYLRLRAIARHRVRTLGDGELLQRIRELAGRAGTAVKSVQLIAGEERPAAFATRRRGILLTSGLVSALSRREVDTIVCHELSHVRRPSTMVPRVASFLIAGGVALAFLAPETLPWMPLLLPPLFLLQRANRRRHEYVADADAATWSGDPEAFITGMLRVTRGLGLPLEWPGWARLLMPHPSTMERIRAAASRAGIAEERFRELLAIPGPPADGYTVSGPAAPDGAAFSTEERKRLNLKLSLLALAIPILSGIAAPFAGYAAAIVGGALASCLLPEWVLQRQRLRTRTVLAGRPGLFCGFSPSAEPRVYDGSYDYDWGFAAFEDGLLAFRGDRGTWTVARREVDRIWVNEGPFNWLPRPGVCVRLKSGDTLCLRPFDGSFALKARKAAADLLQQAADWQAGITERDPVAGDFRAGPVQGQPAPPYTWGTLLRGMPRYAGITLAVQWVILTAAGTLSNNPFAFLGPIGVTVLLTVFMAYPGVRRGRQSLAASAAAAGAGGAR